MRARLQNDTTRCPECGGVHHPSELTEGLCPVGLFDLLGSEAEEVNAVLRDVQAGGWSGGNPVNTASFIAASTVAAGMLPGAMRGSLLAIPGYTVGGEIARGGMGIVYRARQHAPDREVALKMLLPLSAAQPELRERFQIEVRTLAELDHPAILPIYETGEYEGLPWFTMKLAAGGSLAARMETLRGRWREIATLVATLADAAQFAHERGVLHRDLKPGNILFDAEARPFVADFGLAKFVDDERDVTRTQRAMGTPRYLAPEVAATSARQATTASDVYSLGAMLFELLSGRAPFEAEGLPELMRRIVDEEARFPAAKDGAVIPVDLQVIALKALAKKPLQRYASARDLAEELRRFLAGEPILARAASRSERFGRWLRREPALASAIGACVVISVLGVAGIVRQLRETEAARALAVQKAKEEQAQRTLAETARGAAEHSELVMRQNLYAADVLAAQRALDQHDIGTARILLDAHRPAAGQSDLRGFEWRYFWGKARGQSYATFNPSKRGATTVEFSPDGRRLAMGFNEIHVHDFPSLALHAKIGTLSVQSFVFVPGSEAMIIGMRGPSDVRRWNPGGADGVPPLLVDPKGRWPNVALSPGGNVLAVATGADNTGWPEGMTKLYDPATGVERHSLPKSGGMISFSPDGKLLATGSWEGAIKLWHPESGTLVGTLRDAPRVVALDFSSDSRSLVACSHTRGVLIYDVATGTARRMAAGHTAPVWGARISPDGRLLATASGDQSVRIWEMETGRQKAELRGHSYSVGRVAWSPDGKILASGGQDGVRLWKIEEAAAVEPPMNGMARRDYFSPNGRLVAITRTDGHVTLREFPSLNVVAGPKLIGKPIRYIDGGNILVTWQQQANGPAKILRWSVPGLEPISAIELPESKTPLVEPVMPPGGQWLAAGIGPSLLGMWNLDKGVLAAKFGGPAQGGIGRLRTLAFSPNGRYLAGAFQDWPIVLIWDFGKEKPTRVSTARHLGQVAQLAFSADGNTIVTGDTDKFIKFWDVVTGEERATLLGHRSGIASVDISPDGRTVASSSDDGSVRLWNVATRREVARFEGHGVMSQVTFAPDGSALLPTIRGASDRPPVTLVWRAPALSVADEGR